MPVLAMAQLNLKLTVHCEESGTLFVKIQEQIEEIGELSDISELTVTGQLNLDDYNVISNQMKNLVLVDLGGVTNSSDYRMKLQGLSKLETVVLPRNMTKIWDNCFWECGKLASINIPATVTEIGNRAFARCYSLDNVILPEGLKTLEYQTFWLCSSLKNIQLPAGLEEIKEGVFQSTGFTTFTLPSGVKITGKNAFAECGALESFTFPDGLPTAAEVGAGTFSYCRQLKSVRLPADLTEIPEAFFAYTALDTIIFPETVTKIGYQAFYGMTSPKRIVLPDRITSIGSQAFYLNKAIEEVVWPAGCTTMNSDMFRYSNIKKITLPETLTTMSGYNHFLETPLTSVHLPDSLTSLSGGMFSQCGNLAEVNIPKACVRIEGSAFWRTRLTHVDFPDGITYIGVRAFGETRLEDLTLPAKIQTIGGEAFNACRFKHVEVPEGCMYIGASAFRSDSLRCLDLPSTLTVARNTIIGGYKYRCDSIILRTMLPPDTYGDFLPTTNPGTTTLYVPAASLSTYQQDTRFTNRAKDIVAISDGRPASDVINISGAVTMKAGSSLTDRKYYVNFFYQDLHKNQMESDITTAHPSLIIEDGATLTASTIRMDCNVNDYHSGTYTWDCLINRGSLTADNIDLRWKLRDGNYYCPPFDVKVSDIVTEYEGAPIAFFRYDTSARAVSDFSNAWVPLGKDEILKAGTGYIFRGDEVFTGEYYPYAWNHSAITDFSYQHHYPYLGDGKYFLTSSDITLPMQHAAGQFAHNKNWNLVGQPYPAFLDIRGIDYDGPILLRTGSSATSGFWQAYSPLDDEIVIAPMQPVFIQVPDGVESITLKANRRQVSKVFVKGESSNSRMALRRADKNSQRMVFNLRLDKAPLSSPEGDTNVLKSNEAPSGAVGGAFTRFVINPEATTRYDIGRDAPVMAADSVNLLYTMAGGVAYAINERPLDDGIIRLAMQLTKPGTYTLTLSLKDGTVLSGSAAETVWLIDNETGTRTQLLPSLGEGSGMGSYTFEASEAGTISSRFVIAIGNAEPSAIDETEMGMPQRIDGMFNLAGQRISQPNHGLFIKNGRVVFNK